MVVSLFTVFPVSHFFDCKYHSSSIRITTVGSINMWFSDQSFGNSLKTNLHQALAVMVNIFYWDFHSFWWERLLLLCCLSYWVIRVMPTDSFLLLLFFLSAGRHFFTARLSHTFSKIETVTTKALVHTQTQWSHSFELVNTANLHPFFSRCRRVSFILLAYSPDSAWWKRIVQHFQMLLTFLCYWSTAKEYFHTP